MINDIELILSTDLKEVIKSSLSMKLLRIYSILYMGGAAPRCCEKSLTAYYQQLAIDGIQKAKAMKDIIEKTCELKSDLLIYVSPLAMHISNANITDAIAAEGLSKGWFKESQFVQLPSIKNDSKEEDLFDLQSQKKTFKTKR